MRRPQPLALFFAAIPLASSAVIALWGLVWGEGLQCDESCTGEDWQHTAGAAQWTVLTVAGFLAFAAGVALFFFVYRARPWPALAAVCIGTVAIVAALSYWGTVWSDELTRHPFAWGAFACVVVSGVLAALLCAPAGPNGRVKDRTG